MISNARIKQIKSLYDRKNRNKLGLFVAEGEKCVIEIINSDIEIDCVYCTDSVNIFHDNVHVEFISDDEMNRISFLKTPSKFLAVAKTFRKKIDFYEINKTLSLALDDMQDPGNLGTIIRLCDWFGISNIICSLQTVDCFSPKVVQATMGAITRVNVFYGDLQDFFRQIDADLPIYGTFVDGENVYSEKLSKKGIIIIGNEGKGISVAVSEFVGKKLSIPCFSNNKIKPESLNAALAASVICSEFMRR